MGRASYLPLVLLALIFLTHAQQAEFTPSANRFNQTMNVDGIVRTTSGIPISQAKVTIRSLRTGMTVFSGETDADGSFIARLPEDDYEVLAQKGAKQSGVIARPVTMGNVQVVLDNDSSSGGAALASVNELRAPRKAKDALGKAKEAIGRRDLEGAKAQLNKSLHAYPDFAAAQALLAALVIASDPQISFDLSSRAVANDPQNAFAHSVLAANLNNRGDAERGRYEADESIARAPSMWQGHYERGRSLAATQDFEGALASLTRADDLASGQIFALRALRCRILELIGRRDEARQQLAAWIERNPHADEALMAKQVLGEMDRIAKK